MNAERPGADQGPRRRRRFGLFRRRDEGQAAFEFMLIFPLFILLVLLLVDLGVTMYGYVSVSNAAREGARFAAVNCGAAGECDADDVEFRVIERSGGVLTNVDEGDLDIIVRWEDAGASRGSPVHVSVTYRHQLLFFNWQIPVVSCAVMRLEQQDGNAGSLPVGSPCS